MKHSAWCHLHADHSPQLAENKPRVQSQVKDPLRKAFQCNPSFPYDHFLIPFLDRKIFSQLQ